MGDIPEAAARLRLANFFLTGFSKQNSNWSIAARKIFLFIKKLVSLPWPISGNRDLSNGI